MTIRLRDPLPHRAWSETSPGLFSSHPYAESDILRSLASGGWFNPQRSYDFATRSAAQFAADASRVFEELQT